LTCYPEMGEFDRCQQSNIKTDESVKVTQNINETGNGKLITKHLEELVKLAKKNMEPFAIQSTKRQMKRYIDWWLHPSFKLKELQKTQRKDIKLFLRDLLKTFK
jgi:hypothetical protein